MDIIKKYFHLCPALTVLPSAPSKYHQQYHQKVFLVTVIKKYFHLCSTLTVLPSALVTPVAPQVPVARLAGCNQILFGFPNKYFLVFQTNTFWASKQILFGFLNKYFLGFQTNTFWDSKQILFGLSNKYFLGFQTNTFWVFKQILFGIPN